MNFDGIWTPVVTPFTKEGTVDYDVLKKAVDTLIGHGVHGLIVGGTTGEYYALDDGERRQVLEVVAQQAKGRITIMAGINATTTDYSEKLGQHAKSLGYDALLIPAPYYCQPTQQELLTHVCRLDDALDMPVMLYNFPDRTGVPMSFDFIDGLRDRPNFQAIKESTGSIERMHALANDYASQLQLSCGMDDQVLEFFAWGARSWVAGASNFLAPEHVALYQACVVDQDFIAGREIATRLLPVLNLLEQGGKFCQYIKYGCELEGLDVGSARAPLLSLDEDEKVALKRQYDELVKWRR